MQKQWGVDQFGRLVEVSKKRGVVRCSAKNSRLDCSDQKKSRLDCTDLTKSRLDELN